MPLGTAVVRRPLAPARVFPEALLDNTTSELLPF